MTSREHAIATLRAATPGLAAALLAAVFLAAERVPAWDIASKNAVLAAGAPVVAFIVLAAVAVLHRRGTPLRELVRESGSAMLLALAAYGHFLIAGGSGTRVLIVAAVVAFTVMYLREIVHAERQGGGTEDARAFARLSSAVHAVALFFLSAFAFALVGLLQVPAWSLALVIGVAAALLLAETFRRLADSHPEAPAPAALLVCGVYGILATETFWAMTVLPTPFIVNAAVFGILAALAQTVAVRSLRPDEGSVGFRRQAAVSAILILILLLTARWR